jgi:hypothetical protein
MVQKLRPIFEADTLWIKSDPDGKPCTRCKEPIYGDMWGLVVQFAETDIKDTVFSPIDTRLCDPCYIKFIK